MSEENIQPMRRFIDAWNSRDIEAIIACCDRSVEFHPALAALAAVGGVYHGHDGMRSFDREVEDAWADAIRIEPEVYFDLGEHILVFSVLHGRGRQSGVEVVMRVATVSRWRDGLLVYWKTYAQREDAVRDLGVSEDKLEPIEP